MSDKYRDIKLVVFDKDGVIIDFAVWVQWAMEVSNKIASLLQSNEPSDERKDSKVCMARRIREVIGMESGNRSSLVNENPTAKVCSTGLLATGTWLQIRKEIFSCIDGALSETAIQNIMDQHNVPANTKLTMEREELVAILEHLRRKNIQMVILTSDNLRDTQDQLNSFNLLEYFDLIMSKDGIAKRLSGWQLEVNEGQCTFGLPKKTSLQSLQKVMRHMNVKPTETIMIGDTEQDVLLGKGCDVSLTVFITAKSTPAETLEAVRCLNNVIVADSVKCMTDLLP